MSKIIITIDDSKISDEDGIKYISEVIKGGLVSNENTQYCYVTTFISGVRVYAEKTKRGTFTFRVWKTI